MSHWLAGEIHWAQRRMSQAVDAFGAMRAAAARGEHEQFGCMAHLLASQVYAQRGRHDLALAELRRLRRREQHLRTERLESRAGVVAWQMHVRQSEVDLQRMEAASRQFERLSLEDPLTGIANRRCFEIRLAELLRAADEAAEPVSVAFIDVDRFKQVNDRFSHAVGDRVLKGVAQIVQGCVRGRDLAARLAGDEFVVLFARTDVNEAATVCQRIKDAARDFPWNAIANGLQVRLSVGVAQASTGDTVESLLDRSDASMYRDKTVDKTPGAP
jgi:diguanylate cyclase (GGDEF)-like protein